MKYHIVNHNLEPKIEEFTYAIMCPLCNEKTSLTLYYRASLWNETDSKLSLSYSGFNCQLKQSGKRCKYSNCPELVELRNGIEND